MINEGMFLRISENKLNLFNKQNNLTRAIMLKNREIGNHIFEYYNDIYQVDDSVFSPFIFNGFLTFVKGLKNENLKDKTLLEIGTGCGIVALHLLKYDKLKFATLTDLFDNAIVCAQKNAAKLNLLSQCDFLISDIFNSHQLLNRQYDIIFWNYPWLPELDTYKYRDALDHSLFDPGYYLIERYIKEHSAFLSPSGKAYFGFGDYGDWDLLMKICDKYSFAPEIVYEEIGIEGGNVKYQLVRLSQVVK
jgi:release factor glutamine methyltransferase